jgi:hypothetical protein
VSIIHDTLKKAANEKQMVAGNVKSLRWLGTVLRKVKYNPSMFVREERDFYDTVSTVMPGRLYTFFYDPKHKDKLPYFDRFPCVFVIEKYSDGFLALNLHFLNYNERAILLDALYEYETKTKDSSKKRLAVNYSIISAFSKSRYAKHCIKRYLTSHLRSKLLKIEHDYWPIVAMLPIHQFDGKDFKNMSQVWKRNRK